MPKVNPIHSKKNTNVYHDNSKCTERNNIEPENIIKSPGGKRRCKHCARLNKHRR